MDDELQAFYDQRHTPAVLGEPVFLTWVRESLLREVDDKVIAAQVLPGLLSLVDIIRLVADFSNLEAARLTAVVKGPKKGLLARKVAMYLCQQLGGHGLVDIMRPFGLSNSGSVSFITTQIRQQIKANPVLATAI